MADSFFKTLERELVKEKVTQPGMMRSKRRSSALSCIATREECIPHWGIAPRQIKSASSPEGAYKKVQNTLTARTCSVGARSGITTAFPRRQAASAYKHSRSEGLCLSFCLTAGCARHQKTPRTALAARGVSVNVGVRHVGFEPTTLGLEVPCSIQLS